MVNAHQSLQSAIDRRGPEDRELEDLRNTLRLVLRRVGRREEAARAFWADLPRDVIEKCHNGETYWPDEPGSHVSSDG